MDSVLVSREETKTCVRFLSLWLSPSRIKKLLTINNSRLNRKLSEKFSTIKIVINEAAFLFVFPLTVYNISRLYLSVKRAGEEEVASDRHRASWLYHLIIAGASFIT